MNRRTFFRTLAAGLALPVASVIGGKAEPKATFTLASRNDSLGFVAHSDGYQWDIVDGTLEPGEKWPSPWLNKQDIAVAVHDELVRVLQVMSG